jgi:hypothetical protein
VKLVTVTFAAGVEIPAVEPGELVVIDLDGVKRYAEVVLLDLSARPVTLTLAVAG